jgi:dUTP pyrophosphatase
VESDIRPIELASTEKLPAIRVIEVKEGEIPSLDAGFYYDIAEQEVAMTRIFEPMLMEGPFDTKDEAFDDGLAFVKDALTDYNEENAQPQVNIKRLVPEAILPTFGSTGAAGADLYALTDAIVEHGRVTVVRTGIAIELPEGYEAQIRSRSGLAAKHGIQVLNSPGTIDADYRGEISIILVGHITNPMMAFERYTIKAGDRIAQMIVSPVVRPRFNEVAEFLTATERGEGGFGSTGKN